MPLTEKGRRILSAMKETYKNVEKAESVFYASAKGGKIKGVHKKKPKKR